MAHQRTNPVGATTETNKRISDPTARLRGLEVAFDSLTGTLNVEIRN
jgi:hypothetical protein